MYNELVLVSRVEDSLGSALASLFCFEPACSFSRKCISWNLNMLVLILPFLWTLDRTTAEPAIYFMPAKPSEETDKLFQESQQVCSPLKTSASETMPKIAMVI